MELTVNKPEELGLPAPWGNYLITGWTRGQQSSFLRGFILSSVVGPTASLSRECFSATGTYSSTLFSLTGKNITLEFYIYLGVMMLLCW